MVTFNPNIYGQAADRYADQNRQLVDVFSTIAGQYMQSQRLKEAKAEQARKEAQAQALDPTNIYAASLRGEQLTPQQQSVFEATEAMKGQKRALDPLGNVYAPYQPLQLDGQTPVVQPTPSSAPVQADQQDSFSISPKGRLEEEKLMLEEKFAERKAKKAVIKDRPNVDKNFRNVVQGMGDLNDYIDEAIDKSNRWSTGFGAETMAEVGGTEASNLAKVVERIQSSTVLDKMAQMKAQSSTGATGFGAMNQSELGLLKNSVVALSQSQTEDEFDKNARKLKAVNERIKNNMAEDYKGLYGEYPKGFKPTESKGERPLSDMSTEELKALLEQ